MNTIKTIEKNVAIVCQIILLSHSLCSIGLWNEILHTPILDFWITMQRYEKNLTWPKDLSIFLVFPRKKKESQLAPAFKKEKYNENCKTLSQIQRYLYWRTPTTEVVGFFDYLHNCFTVRWSLTVAPVVGNALPTCYVKYIYCCVNIAEVRRLERRRQSPGLPV